MFMAFQVWKFHVTKFIFILRNLAQMGLEQQPKVELVTQMKTQEKLIRESPN